MIGESFCIDDLRAIVHMAVFKTLRVPSWEEPTGAQNRGK